MGELERRPAAGALGGYHPAGRITDTQLAVLFTQLHWVLDDAAHDWPRGEVLPAEREQLVATLVNLAEIIRASAPGGTVDSI